MNPRDWPRTIRTYGIATALCLAALTVHYRLWEADLSIPFHYSARTDAFFNYMVVKTVTEHGWYLENPSLGLPGAMRLHDFPMTNDLNMLAIKALGLLARDPFVTANLFYLATFVVTTWTALLAFRRCGISDPFSVVGALSFALLPYHFARGQVHLFLSAYHAIPLIALVALWVAEGRPVFFAGHGRGDRRAGDAALAGLACVLLAGSDVYYAYFGCFLLAVAGLIAGLTRRSRAGAADALAMIGLVTALFLASIAPTLLHSWRHGANPAPTGHSYVEADIFGLRIANLLKPSPGHWLYSVVAVDQPAPPVNENRFSYLGVPGVLGFLVLMLALFVLRPLPGRLAPLGSLSRLNVAAVLLGTRGGFGYLFAGLISHQIRGYNRISIVIAFYALLALLIVLEALVDLLRPLSRRAAVAGLTGPLLVLALISQVPLTARPDYPALAAEFGHDRGFIRGIEASLPRGAAVFQLPVEGLPDRGRHRMAQFAHLRGYLHAQHLRWSGAAIRGRETDRWQQRVASLPVDAMLRELAEAGFSGLYVDRRGYRDGAAELEADLARLLGRGPLRSDDRRFLFFPLRRPGGEGSTAGAG